MSEAIIAKKAELVDVGIEKEGNHTFFEVELEDPCKAGGSREIEITVREDGRVMETQWEVFKDELPPGVLTYTREHYAGEKFDEAVKVQEGEKFWFEVTLTKPDGEDRDLLFDRDGIFLAEDD